MELWMTKIKSELRDDGGPVFLSEYPQDGDVLGWLELHRDRDPLGIFTSHWHDKAADEIKRLRAENQVLINERDKAKRERQNALDYVIKAQNAVNCSYVLDANLNERVKELEQELEVEETRFNNLSDMLATFSNEHQKLLVKIKQLEDDMGEGGRRLVMENMYLQDQQKDTLKTLKGLKLTLEDALDQTTLFWMKEIGSSAQITLSCLINRMQKNEDKTSTEESAAKLFFPFDRP